MTITEMRADFIVRRRGSIALPLTGVIVYSTAAVLSLFSEQADHNLILTLCFWSIMPLGAAISRWRGEEMGSPPLNPLFALSGLARLMVLSTWAIHVPVWVHAPSLLPLTMGIGFALHWVIFSWSIGHPLGVVHLATRIVLVVGAWHLCPANRMGAVALGVATAYAISLLQLVSIDWKRRLGLDFDPRGRSFRQGWPVS